MSFLTGTNFELIYQNVASGTAKASFTSEAQINDTTGMGAQAVLPARFWSPFYGEDRTIRILARGIISSTATPTYTFTCRLGAAGTTAPIVLGSGAITTGSSISNQLFEFEGDVVMRNLGPDGANSTVQGLGNVESNGLVSSSGSALWGGAASPGTVATVDASIANFISFNVTCSASSSSNSVQLLQLQVWGMN